LLELPLPTFCTDLCMDLAFAQVYNSAHRCVSATPHSTLIETALVNAESLPAAVAASAAPPVHTSAVATLPLKRQVLVSHTWQDHGAKTFAASILEPSMEAASAASVAPPVNPSVVASLPLKRQVFVSHTGKDKDAKTFAASILKPALEAAGLEVFMDFSSLQLGCSWPQELMDAAANSMVVVVVLSNSYTGQFWCMLELDLALHSHQQSEQEGADSSSKCPLVIPVFYDPVNGIVDTANIKHRWSHALEQRLMTDEALGPEWSHTVDVERWTNNIVSLMSKLQHMRHTRRGQDASKDEEWQLAREVVRVAVKHIPSRVAVAEVVGFEEQEVALAAQLGGRLGLWLYGQGVPPPMYCLQWANSQSVLCARYLGYNC
jgi:hypothetical protein